MAHSSSLFDQLRAGTAVVRPSDLLALRIELVNLEIVAGAPPEISRVNADPAFIILHFPPQSIAEEVFGENSPEGITGKGDLQGKQALKAKPDPPSTETKSPPIKARAAGESRLVFKIPEVFSAPYTLAGVLEACQKLSLSVSGNALPPNTDELFPILPGPFVNAQNIAALSSKQRVALAGLSLRANLLAASEGFASSTLAARVSQSAAGITISTGVGHIAMPRFNRGPKPGLPSTNQTSIEMPWRLILSPHAQERFVHASQPVTSALTARTELWHSRLVAPDESGNIIEPPNCDQKRTTRAVWALTGENSDTDNPMTSEFPASNALPRVDPPTTPFLTTLDDFDRFQIVHLSSNFSRSKSLLGNYKPRALDTQLLMLSSLGGWLDLKGGWDPGGCGLSVEEWTHRASMGRDHYVRVVYKGFLYPFGHRVSLIKVSERKFHNHTTGNVAYLRQRMFIVVRERERTYVDPQLTESDGKSFQRQFPFNKVRILTEVTPNLDRPDAPVCEIIHNLGQKFFWPCVNGAPFKFRCVGTDIDNRNVQFELPMIFMDNTLAGPQKDNGDPDFGTARSWAEKAHNEWRDRSDSAAPRRFADLNSQRVAFAPSVKAGDTSSEVQSMEFGGHCVAANDSSGEDALCAYSNNLSQPLFYPKVVSAEVRIPAIAQLAGSNATNNLKWHDTYLRDGFDPPDVNPALAKNKGQVFAKLDETPSSNSAKLDFSSQGDRAGGFVMPNLKPSGLSRLSGPVSGPIDKFLSGAPIGGTEMFPGGVSDLPLPLLFGCIPLGEILKEMAGGGDKLPNFVSEASNKLESFFNELVRAYHFIENIGSQSGSLAAGAVEAVKFTINDLEDQTKVLPNTQIAQMQSKLVDVQAKLSDLLVSFRNIAPNSGTPLSTKDINDVLAGGEGALLTANINSAILAMENLRTHVSSATLPSGFKQSTLSVVTQALLFLNDANTIQQLVVHASALYESLKKIVENSDLFSDFSALATALDDVRNKMGDVRTDVTSFRLLDGAPRKTVVDALDALIELLGNVSDLKPLLESLLGDELVVRFDWKPEIDNWALPGSDKAKDPIFRANDKHGFIVAVEAKVKKSGGSPKISVVSSLKHFDLILIAPASFMELNFEKIEFKIDQSTKMNVDVLLTDIKFLGPLSFVETLKDLIPLDGFSDPPYLDITPSGINAGFSLALPNISVGMFSLSNLSLGAGFTVPFIGQPLSVRFNFCTREQPFNLTVTLFGGGGFFGITIDPHGVQILEAALEFGASVSIDFGVASGGVHVMAGIYFRMEKTAAKIAGYFRLGGHVSVLGIISASIELYLEISYETETGKCVGKAVLTIEVSVFMFSVSVKISCERKFAGSNGDPTFRQIMGLDSTLSLTDELMQIHDDTNYAWREYCEAFS